MADIVSAIFLPKCQSSGFFGLRGCRGVLEPGRQGMLSRGRDTRGTPRDRLGGWADSVSARIGCRVHGATPRGQGLSSPVSESDSACWAAQAVAASTATVDAVGRTPR